MENSRDPNLEIKNIPTAFKHANKFPPGFNIPTTGVQQGLIFPNPFNPPKIGEQKLGNNLQQAPNKPNIYPGQAYIPVPKLENNKGSNPLDFAKNNQTLPMPQKLPFSNTQGDFLPNNSEGPPPSQKQPLFLDPSNLNSPKTIQILPNTQSTNTNFIVPSNKSNQGLINLSTSNQQNFPISAPTIPTSIPNKSSSINPQLPSSNVPNNLKIVRKPLTTTPETQLKGQIFSDNLIKNPQEIQKLLLPVPKFQPKVDIKPEPDEKNLINPTWMHIPKNPVSNLPNLSNFDKGFQKVEEKKCPESGKFGPSEYKPDFNKGILQSKDDDSCKLPRSEHVEIHDLSKPILDQKETIGKVTDPIALKPNSTVKLYLKMIGVCASAIDLRKINKKDGFSDLNEKKSKLSQKNLKEIKEIHCIKCQELKISVNLQCTHIECFNCFKQNVGNFISNPSQKTFKKASCKGCYINYSLEDIEKILGNDTLQKYQKQNSKNKCMKCGLGLNLQTNYFSELDCLHLCGVCYSTEIFNDVTSCFFCGEIFRNLNSTISRKSSCDLCHQNCCEDKCSCKFATVNQMCHTLPCGHTLCFLCTVNKDAKNHCPICNQVIKVGGRLRIFLQVMRYCIKCKNTFFILENQSLQCSACLQDN